MFWSVNIETTANGKQPILVHADFLVQKGDWFNDWNCHNKERSEECWFTDVNTR